MAHGCADDSPRNDDRHEDGDLLRDGDCLIVTNRPKDGYSPREYILEIVTVLEMLTLLAMVTILGMVNIL